MSKKKLFVTGGDDIFGVAKLLHKEFDLIVMYQQWADTLRNIDIPCQVITEATTDEIRIDASVDATRAMASIYATLPKAMKKNFSQRVIDEVFPRFINTAYGLVNESAMIAKTLTALDVAGAVVHNDVEPATRTVAMWCKSHGKPCIHLPHAIYLDYERGEPGTDVHDMVTASHLASAGPYQSIWYSERGMKNIRETGIPRFDRLYSLPINKQKARELLKLDQGRPVISYYSSWRQNTNLLGCNDGVEEAYVNFLTAVKNVPGIQPIVKTHPRGGNLEWHIKTAKEYGVPCVATDRYLDVVLQASDVCIAYGPSNVILEAAVLGKSLVSIGGFGNDNEVMTITPSVEDITIGIVGGLQAMNPTMPLFLAKYLGIPDGQATQRAARYIYECCI